MSARWAEFVLSGVAHNIHSFLILFPPSRFSDTKVGAFLAQFLSSAALLLHVLV